MTLGVETGRRLGNLLLRSAERVFPFLPDLRTGLLKCKRRAATPLRWLPGDSRFFGPPRRFHAGDLRSLVRDDVALHELYPAASLRRELPPTNSDRVREKFGQCLEPALCAGQVTVLTDGRYVGGEGGGSVLSARDELVIVLSPPKFDLGRPEYHPALARCWLPPARTVDSAIVLATPAAEQAYGHWMKDLLPRLGLVRAAGLEPPDAFYIINHRNLPHQREAFARLGLPPARIIAPHPNSHLRARRLIVPGLMHPGLNSDWHGYPESAFSFLRRTFLPEPPAVPSGRRWFISRRRTLRHIHDEAAVLAALAPLGFEACELETMSVAAQAELFYHAEAVAGLHGAGFNNLVFCRPGTAVLEIFSPDFIVTNFWGLAGQLGLRYGCYCEDEHYRGLRFNRLQREHTVEVDATRFASWAAAFLADVASLPVR